MKLIDLEDLPDPGEDPAGAADLYLSLAPLRSWLSTASRSLKALVEQGGPIEGFEGVLTLVHDEWDYPPRIADEIPDFGVNHYEFNLRPDVDHERVRDILIESMPENASDVQKSWKVETIVDRNRCKVWSTDKELRQTAAGRRILELRQSKKKLGQK